VIINKNAYYTINIKCPKLYNANPNLKQSFQDAVQAMLAMMINDFTKDLTSPNELDNMAGSATTKMSADSNVLDINYKIYDIDENHISILFSQYVYFYSSAHPNTYFRSLNYSLKTGKILSLADLFKPNSDFLNKFSHLCFDQLKITLPKGDPQYTFEMLENGLKPSSDNFNIWNFTDKGILFSFPPYQVASYAEGPQRCLIPYVKVKELTNPISF
jgi:hypothetical protein